MPIKSQAQWKSLFAKANRGELPMSVAKEMAHKTSTPFKQLPMHSSKKQHEHLPDHAARKALNQEDTGSGNVQGITGMGFGRKKMVRRHYPYNLEAHEPVERLGEATHEHHAGEFKVGEKVHFAGRYGPMPVIVKKHLPAATHGKNRLVVAHAATGKEIQVGAHELSRSPTKQEQMDAIAERATRALLGLPDMDEARYKGTVNDPSWRRMNKLKGGGPCECESSRCLHSGPGGHGKCDQKAAAGKKHQTTYGTQLCADCTHRTPAQYMHKESIDEKYVGFSKLSASLAHKGVRDPGALAASIGRKKYGASAFNKASHAGKKMRGMKHEQTTEAYQPSDPNAQASPEGILMGQRGKVYSFSDMAQMGTDKAMQGHQRQLAKSASEGPVAAVQDYQYALEQIGPAYWLRPELRMAVRSGQPVDGLLGESEKKIPYGFDHAPFHKSTAANRVAKATEKLRKQKEYLKGFSGLSGSHKTQMAMAQTAERREKKHSMGKGGSGGY